MPLSIVHSPKLYTIVCELAIEKLGAVHSSVRSPGKSMSVLSAGGCILARYSVDATGREAIIVRYEVDHWALNQLLS